MKIWIDGALAGSVASACALEDEIERRRLWAAYTEALIKYVDCPSPTNEPWAVEDAWNFIRRATPEQRARAFLEAVKVKS